MRGRGRWRWRGRWYGFLEQKVCYLCQQSGFSARGWRISIGWMLVRGGEMVGLVEGITIFDVGVGYLIV